MIPTASVTLVVNGLEMTGAATGDGPVDAAMEVLEMRGRCCDIRSKEYHVNANTGRHGRTGSM